MKIGLDARSMFMPRPRGTGRNLRDAFALIPDLRPEWEFVLYHQRGEIEDTTGNAERRPVGDWSPEDALPSNVTARRIDIPGDRFDAWLNLRLPWTARREGVDLLHFPANAAPAYCPVPYVVTIHDLIPLRVEGECPPEARRRFERGVRRAVRGAAHIITPSQATRDDLIEWFGVAEDRVTVVPWAADREVVAAWQSPDSGHGTAGGSPADGCGPAAPRSRHPAVAAARSKYGLQREYWIGFSGESPRKNAAGLIEAVGTLARTHPAVDVELLLVGCEPAACAARLTELARRAGVGDRCRVLGFVPHGDIAGLLGGARALLMPSLCEGFGLPILDAFALGVPVLTSGFGSMAEVAGDGALYCDPRNAGSIARGMAALLDEGTVERLTRRGAAREGEFTWRRTAEAMCEVYEACAWGGLPARRAGWKPATPRVSDCPAAPPRAKVAQL